MMSASHFPRTALAELGDVLWLSYYHLVGRPRRTQLDGFVSRPVRALRLDGHLPRRSR